MDKESSNSRLDKVVAEAQQQRLSRHAGYRAQSLKLHPWVCGKCGREFTRANLHELTVHHKDHNHDNNPADGSNWENLCLYCHDNVHRRFADRVLGFDPLMSGTATATKTQNSTFKGLAGLGDLLKTKKNS